MRLPTLQVRVIRHCEQTIGALLEKCGTAAFDTLSFCGGKQLLATLPNLSSGEL